MKKKILKILLKLLIVIIIGIGIFFLVKYFGTKQIIEEDITDIKIECVRSEKEVVLKKDEIVKLTAYIKRIYKIKDGNFNKWDLNDKYKVIINNDNNLKITDYAGTTYYGYYNDDNVVVSEDIYNKIASYCKED